MGWNKDEAKIDENTRVGISTLYNTDKRNVTFFSMEGLCYLRFGYRGEVEWTIDRDSPPEWRSADSGILENIFKYAYTHVEPFDISRIFKHAYPRVEPFGSYGSGITRVTKDDRRMIHLLMFNGCYHLRFEYFDGSKPPVEWTHDRDNELFIEELETIYDVWTGKVGNNRKAEIHVINSKLLIVG